MTFTFDTGELNELAADLRNAPQVLGSDLRGIIQKGALNIKNDARRFATGLRHAPAYPSSITYDTYYTPGGVRAEIGPDRALGPAKQGFLGAILEYGGIHSGPNAHMGPALDREGPRFEQAIADAAEEALQ